MIAEPDKLSYYRHPAAPVISYEDRAVLTSTNLLQSDIQYRLCPYCSKPLWVSSLQYHIESSCPKAPPLSKLVSDSNLRFNTKFKISPSENGLSTASTNSPNSNTNNTNTTSSPLRKKRKQTIPIVEQSQSPNAASTNNSPLKKRKIDSSKDDVNLAHPEPLLEDQSPPKKKTRKFNMTKQRRQALEEARARAIANGEEPPTIDQLDLAKITKKTGKKQQRQQQRKEKEKVKAKSTKPKAPVNVEKQCGVLLPDGSKCARSLTCKTHTMSAKRAVPGRSASYDVLLLNYQKMNQVKLASMSTVQQLADENEALGGSAVDPDEEVQLVMEGVQRSIPVPLEQNVIVPVRIKNSFIKMRELLANALLPRGVRPPSSGILGRSLAVDPDHPDEGQRTINPIVRQQKYLQIQAQQAQVRSALQQPTTALTPQQQVQLSTETEAQSQVRALNQAKAQAQLRKLTPHQQQLLQKQIYLQRRQMVQLANTATTLESQMHSQP